MILALLLSGCEMSIPLTGEDMEREEISFRISKGWNSACSVHVEFDRGYQGVIQCPSGSQKITNIQRLTNGHVLYEVME